MTSIKLDQNLTLWKPNTQPESVSNGSSVLQESNGKNEPSNNQSKESNSPGKLVILFAYMLPKDRHIEKYDNVTFTINMVLMY